MKDRLLVTLAALLFIAVALGLGCLIAPLDAQADPTPTSESLMVHSFGHNGVPIIPARDVTVLGTINYYALDHVTYLGHDIVGDTVYQRYISDGTCFVLAWSLDTEVGLGDDGMPHPDAAYEVECS